MGEGVAKNPSEAAKWWKKAAEQDHADAQYFLGLSYSLGLGVPKIQKQAIYWLRKAVINGNKNALAALKNLG
jgi:TPR repeat protein